MLLNMMAVASQSTYQGYPLEEPYDPRHVFTYLIFKKLKATNSNLFYMACQPQEKACLGVLFLVILKLLAITKLSFWKSSSINNFCIQ